MKKCFLFVLMVSLFNCSDNKKRNGDTTVKTTLLNSKIKLDENPRIDYLKKMMIDSGRNNTYSKFLYFYESGDINTREFLIYSMIMSDKHNDCSGYINTFMYSVMYFANSDVKQEFNINDFSKLNKKQKAFAISYLNKGSKNNCIGCTSALIKIYDKGIGYDKNSKKADSLFNVAKTIDPSFRVLD